MESTWIIQVHQLCYILVFVQYSKVLLPENRKEGRKDHLMEFHTSCREKVITEHVQTIVYSLGSNFRREDGVGVERH